MAEGLTVLSVLDLDPRKVGSFEEYLCALGRQLRAAGGRCAVAVSAPPAPDVAHKFESNAVEWHVLPFGAKLPSLAAALRRLVRRVRPDITHFHFVGTMSPLYLVAWASGGGRILTSYHTSHSIALTSQLPQIATRWRRRLMLAPCARLITPSAYVRDCLVSYQEISANRITVIHNGVNLRRFDPTRGPSFDVRAQYEIPPNAPIVSTVAYFIPEKGGADLIRALPKVRERVPETHLLLIGDGPELPRLKALAAELDQTSHIRFTGLASGDQLDSLIAASLITTLVCTWGEAFSLVVLEFMAYGKPIVATSVGGTPEAVEDGVTGLLVDPNAPDQIARALVTLLTNSDRAQQMGRAARARAEALFDVERMTAQTLSVYDTVHDR